MRVWCSDVHWRLLWLGLLKALVIHLHWAAMSVLRAGMQPCPQELPMH
jgi:hypothetical protein